MHSVQVLDANSCSAIDSLSLTFVDSLDAVAAPLSTKGNWMLAQYDWIGTRNDEDLVLKTNSVEAMRITNDGNVGIGTAEPDAKLHVAENAKITGDLGLTDLQYEVNDPPSGEILRMVGITPDGELRTFGDPIIAGTENGPFDPEAVCGDAELSWHRIGATNNIANCRNGNVSIGTMSDDERLTVAGNISLNDITGARSIIGNINSGGSTSGFSIFGHTLKTDGAFIQMNGCSTSTDPNALILGTKQYAPIILQTVNSGGTATNVMKMSDGYVTVTGNTSISGNVGIGIINPSEKLEVDGNAIVSGDVSLNPSSGPRYLQGNVNDAGTSAFTVAGNTNASDGGFIEFYGSGSDKEGTVVIGSYGPYGESSKGIVFMNYDIYGNNGNPAWIENMRVTTHDGVMAKRLRVTLNNWYDYVLAPDYPLISLTERMEWINANNRMPEMPSTKEVIEDGADVGLIISGLTKNTEELYLFLNDLSKHVELLKKENELLKERIIEIENQTSK